MFLSVESKVGGMESQFYDLVAQFAVLGESDRESRVEARGLTGEAGRQWAEAKRLAGVSPIPHFLKTFEE